jgi:PKD repeat protein
LTVQFTDQSTGTAPLTYAWDFNNDGSTDSTVKSPSFAYQTSGTYTVKLTVTNANGTDSEIKTGYISVSSIQSGSCYGAETCNPTGNPIGGGAGYTRIITETDSRVKYVVTTRDQLLTALKSAKAGEVVFVPSSATIDLTGASTVTIPAGVILASDRGYNGRAGGLIKRDNSGTIPLATFMAGGDNVRFTGLRIQGPHSGYGADYGDNVKCAIMEENRNGLEVDNCEIYYWSYAGVAFENTRNSAWSGNVHHNTIHHIAGEGYGYGVMVAYGDVLIEANNFDYTRHAVIGEGCPGEKFVYRYNYYGSHSLNPVLDLHTNCGGWSAGGVSGRLYDIHHNTIVYAGSVTLNAYGTPSEGLYITKNILATPVQALNGPTRIFMTDNRVAGKLVASGPVN